MPNGKGFAQCGECINLIAGDKPRCKKHDFAFPIIVIEYEMLCRDYTPAFSYSEESSNEIRSLEAGYLFYYCSQGERNYKKLEKFTELRQPIYGIRLIEDKRYKWIFEVENYYKGLWDRETIVLRYDSKEETFIQRKLTKEMFTSYTVATKKVLYTPQNITAFLPQNKDSDFFNSFVESFIDLEEYRNKKKLREELLVFGVSVFLKGFKDSVYEITPDLHFKDFFEKSLQK